MRRVPGMQVRMVRIDIKALVQMAVVALVLYQVTSAPFLVCVVKSAMDDVNMRVLHDACCGQDLQNGVCHKEIWKIVSMGIKLGSVESI